MKSVPFSSCEREFILQSIRSKKRLDGRETYDFRKLRISFGVDRGHCEVQLGRTRVLAQVSCEVTQPKPNRPTEGQLFVNVELSPMASPAFESGRTTEFGVELNRFMERFFVECRAIDVESLCIVAGEKVWSVRVDLHVLDNGGNIADCASIAAITALAHFRRPDVSVIGEEVTIHPPEDRDPVPLSVLHMPVCVTFSFFDEGELLLVDPTEKEEIVMSGRMIMAMNIHREICGAVLDGGVSLESHQILRCSQIASVKVAEIIGVIQRALSEDTKQREIGNLGQIESDMKSSLITVTLADKTGIDITKAVESDRSTEVPSPQDENEVEWYAELKGPGTAQIGEGGDNTWHVIDSIDEDMTDSDDVTIVDVKTRTDSRASNTEKKSNSQVRMKEFAQKLTSVAPVVTTVVATVEIDSSEEEDVVVLTYDNKEGFQNSSKPRNPPDALNLNVALKAANEVKQDEKTGNKKKKRKNKAGNKTSSTPP